MNFGDISIIFVPVTASLIDSDLVAVGKCKDLIERVMRVVHHDLLDQRR